MALSKVRIANFALSKLGRKSNIESLTEDSAEAGEVNLWYDFCLDMALASYDWSFARKRVALATHSSTVPTEWAYAYQYPQ